jgi:AcrR family transcriptional regulator
VPRGKRATQRKEPSQARSRSMVATIVQATTRVLLKEGYEACTTNRVAEAAGVSIGSVYQYFPNKEALVVAVMERYQAGLHEALVARLAELADADLETAVRGMVSALLEVPLLQPRLYRVLLEQVPRIGALKRLHELHGQYVPLVEAWLEAHRAEVGVSSPSVAAWVLVASVEGVLARAMLERPGWVELGILEEQVTRLVLNYLARPGSQKRLTLFKRR